MIVNSKELLQNAKSGKYCILAPDYVDLDSAKTFVNTAEKAGKPIILSFAQVLNDVIALDEAAAVGRFVAERANIPVVLHLDHGEDIGYIKKAVESGFTSVMIDASMKSFDENVRETKEIVEFSHSRGVTVEAEIGHVGRGENYTDYQNSDSVYTEVEEAVEFWNRTGVDSLAVSIGTAHGIYKGMEKPALNFERLHQLADALPIPLVLHGGSGSGDENLYRCACEGITKINIFTDFMLGAMEKINEEKPGDYLSLKKAANQGMAQILEHYFNVFYR